MDRTEPPTSRPDILSGESKPLGGARVIHQELTDRIEAATAVLPLEPPESGDFHESLTVPDGSGDVAVLLGDVTGHGAAAAEKADKIRRVAISSLQAGSSPLETVKLANETTLKGDDERFSTLFIAKISGEDGHITYANAGHEPPLLAHQTGNPEELLTTGPPLGIVATAPELYTEHTAQLHDGETLLATTDGVLEARKLTDSKLDFFGADRLKSVLTKVRHFSPIKIVSTVISSVIAFAKDGLHDDVVVMAVKRHSRT